MMSPLARQTLNPLSRRNWRFTCFVLGGIGIAYIWYSGEPPAQTADGKAHPHQTHYTMADIPQLRIHLTTLTNSQAHLKAKFPLLQDTNRYAQLLAAMEEATYAPDIYSLFQRARNRGNELAGRRLPSLRATALFEQGYQDELAAQPGSIDPAKRAQARVRLEARCSASLTNQLYKEDLRQLESYRLSCAGDQELDAANEAYQAALWPELTHRHPELAAVVAQAQQSWVENQAITREINSIQRDVERLEGHEPYDSEEMLARLPPEVRRELEAIAGSRLTKRQKEERSRMVIHRAKIRELFHPTVRTDELTPEQELWRRFERLTAHGAVTQPAAAAPTAASPVNLASAVVVANGNSTPAFCGIPVKVLWNAVWPYLMLIVVGIGLSSPPELQQGRWLQMGLSCVALYFMRRALADTSNVLALDEQWERSWIHYRNGSIALGVFWGPNLAYFFYYFVDAPDPDPIGYVDSGVARKAYRDGEYKKALRLAARELERDPEDYECLLLTAQVHRRLGNRWRANRALRQIVRSKRSSEAQKTHARQLLAHQGKPKTEPIQIVGLKLSKWDYGTDEEA
jgi:hypothetical protein